MNESFREEKMRYRFHLRFGTKGCYTWLDNKVRELILEGLFIMNLYELDTVNQVYYLEVLKRLREKVRRNRPELSASNSWILHHVNAPAHTALSVREFLATKQITPCLFTGSSPQ
jgi:hypothetical protein